MLLSIAFLPVSDVSTAFETLQKTCPETAHPIFNYFEDNYVGRLSAANGTRQNPRFDVDSWSCHQRVITGRPRTNNAVEGWNTNVYAPSAGMLRLSANKKGHKIICTTLEKTCRDCATFTYGAAVSDLRKSAATIHAQNEDSTSSNQETSGQLRQIKKNRRNIARPKKSMNCRRTCLAQKIGPFLCDPKM